MGKFVAGDGQYVVYASNVQEAKQVLSQEIKRVNEIKAKVQALLSKDGGARQNFETNTSAENLNIYFYDESSLIYDNPENATTKGEVRQRKLEDGKFTYDLAYRYPEIQGQNADFRLAHEMGHLVLNPSDVSRQAIDSETGTRQVSGLIRLDENEQFYGIEIQESAINLIGQLAIRGEHSADDIITGKIDVSEFNSYRKTDELVKLLATSMRNDYTQEMSFEDLANTGLDSVIEHSDGTKEPANTFFYGMVNDSSIIQKEFDKYMGQGAWIDLNTFITNLQTKDLSNEQFDMIYSEAKGMIMDFANARMHDKYQEAMDRDGTDIPNIDNKIATLNETAGIQNDTRFVQQMEDKESEMPEGYSINEFGEIIRPAKDGVEFDDGRIRRNTESVNSYDNIPTFVPPNEPEHNNNLSLKQRIALFLQKNNLFMNLSFVENFVHQQLDILPETTQGYRQENVSTANTTREDFINQLSNFGQYRNLPPIQRMSDPEKLAEMRRKMEENQQENDGSER